MNSNNIFDLIFTLIENVIIFSSKVFEQLTKTRNIFGYEITLIELIATSLATLILAKFIASLVRPSA